MKLLRQAKRPRYLCRKGAAFGNEGCSRFCNLILSERWCLSLGFRFSTAGIYVYPGIVVAFQKLRVRGVNPWHNAST